MTDNQTDRVVVITGGSSGIGRATALLFASRGWSVGLIARNEEGLSEVRDEIVQRGGRATFAIADVGDGTALDRAALQLETELGPFEVWINDAGAGFFAPFMDITDDEFRRVTETTYMGAVNGTRTALRHMRERDRGSINSVGSVAAYRGFPLQAPYCGAKFALRGFTEAVRSELLHDRSRIHLGLVHPPAINTPFFSHAGARMPGAPKPPPPIYQPEVVAEALYLAATQRRREVVVGAGGLGFVWMNKIAPGLMDRAMGWMAVGQQQTQDADAVRRQDPSLFRPSSGRPPARAQWGGFERSPTLWISRNRTALLGLVALLGFAGRRLLRR